MLRFSLASLLVLITLAGLSCAALLNPNVYFATGFHLTMLAAVLASVYLAIFSQGTRRRLAGGFVVFVIGSQLWPLWFGDSIHLTDRIASSITNPSGLPMSQPLSYVQAWPSYPTTSYSPYNVSNLIPVYTSPSSPPGGGQALAVNEIDYFSMRTVVGSLLSLGAGIAGMLLASIMNRVDSSARPRLPQHESGSRASTRKRKQERSMPTRGRGHLRLIVFCPP